MLRMFVVGGAFVLTVFEALAQPVFTVDPQIRKSPGIQLKVPTNGDSGTYLFKTTPRPKKICDKCLSGGGEWEPICALMYCVPNVNAAESTPLSLENLRYDIERSRLHVESLRSKGVLPPSRYNEFLDDYRADINLYRQSIKDVLNR